MHKASFVTYLSLIIFAIYVSLEFLNIEVDNSLLYGMLALWLGTILLFDSHTVIPILSNKRYLLFLLFLLFYFFSSLIVVSTGTALNRIISFVHIFTPVLMYDYYCKLGRGIRMFIILVFVVLLLIDIPVLLNTIQISGLGLRVGNSDDYRIKISYNLTYSLVLLASGLSYIISNAISKDNINKFLICSLILITAGFVVIVIMSLYMTAIVITLLGVILAFLYKKKRWIAKSVITMAMVLGAFLLLFQPLMNAITDYTVDLSTRALYERTAEINMLLTGEGSSAEDFNDRRDLSGKSINTFLAHPLFGVNHKVSNYELMGELYVGNHSTWVDSLARYGLFALLIFSFLFRSGKKISKETGADWALLVFAVLGFFNPVFYFPQLSMPFLLVPFLSEVILKKHESSI